MIEVVFLFFIYVYLNTTRMSCRKANMDVIQSRLALRKARGLGVGRHTDCSVSFRGLLWSGQTNAETLP